MVNKKILLSIVIVLVIGVAAASYQITTNTPGLLQPTTTQNQKSPDQVTNTPSGGTQSGTQTGITSTSKGSQSTTGGNGLNGVKISANEAKLIVIKNGYIQQPGATAGTPTLQNMNGTKVWVVPVIYQGRQAGEIDIDAQTGRNIGGAGGAP